jgi:hypothetical protein
VNQQKSTTGASMKVQEPISRSSTTFSKGLHFQETDASVKINAGVNKTYSRNKCWEIVLQSDEMHYKRLRRDVPARNAEQKVHLQLLLELWMLKRFGMCKCEDNSALPEMLLLFLKRWDYRAEEAMDGAYVRQKMSAPGMWEVHCISQMG